MYRNLQPHRAVLPAIARHLVLASRDIVYYTDDITLLLLMLMMMLMM